LRSCAALFQECVQALRRHASIGKVAAFQKRIEIVGFQFDTLAELAADLPPAARATVGVPGMIRHGVVITTPHYVTEAGPRSKPVAELVEQWTGFDARAAISERLGMPTLVLNDAEVHGAGVVTGAGLELVITLGTGLGCALFDGGRLAPHLELSQAPVRWGLSYDTYVGDKERKRLGPAF